MKGDRLHSFPRGDTERNGCPYSQKKLETAKME
jgi:hypothetical protein